MVEKFTETNSNFLCHSDRLFKDSFIVRTNFIRLLLVGYYHEIRYQSSFKNGDPVFAPNNKFGKDYYYEALPFTVFNTATYGFTSQQQLELNAYIYANNFNPNNANTNLIKSITDPSFSKFASTSVDLQAMKNYVLVVTTRSSRKQGGFYLTILKSTGLLLFEDQGEYWKKIDLP